MALVRYPQADDAAACLPASAEHYPANAPAVREIMHIRYLITLKLESRI